MSANQAVLIASNDQPINPYSCKPFNHILATTEPIEIDFSTRKLAFAFVPCDRTAKRKRGSWWNDVHTVHRNCQREVNVLISAENISNVSKYMIRDKDDVSEPCTQIQSLLCLYHPCDTRRSCGGVPNSSASHWSHTGVSGKCFGGR